ncbi:MAG: hypothetical protein ACD_51C00295G0003 [uncultured bacterium]|nr:MAG: hypothetical protein ACD_51C00295G0003 [uncultured bacterium]OGJ48140.1 MAG: hypothetical protein A2244_01485 [Candidatus Peregrinibacteria bacterium RIFOXYA2_FULL_41_18]OGJ49043.1 MAG: hypothetical protein A2344_00730 [Candidatus Peregrinibacteria bacterium RIFOXYB12_FULL_41_12]OGJ54318.1 MAG: hypothetical protein A2336_00310 [Candidatus Peregrinibacteria bacterium RIFOXYB2_FULL_41_88]
MADFVAQIQAFTCIKDESKKKILDACARLDASGQEKVIAVLSQGEAKKKAIIDEHDTKMLELIEAHLKEVDAFKKGPLRQGIKQAEEVVHTGEDKAAEDLLKGI